MKFRICLFLASLFFFPLTKVHAFWGLFGGGGAEKESPLVLIFSPFWGNENLFWKGALQGARAAAGDLGFKVKMRKETQDGRFSSSLPPALPPVKGIVIFNLNPQSGFLSRMETLLEEWQKQGVLEKEIPLVIIQEILPKEGVPTRPHVSWVGTDYRAAGKAVAKRPFSSLPLKNGVVVLSPGAFSSEELFQGIQEMATAQGHQIRRMELLGKLTPVPSSSVVFCLETSCPPGPSGRIWSSPRPRPYAMGYTGVLHAVSAPTMEESIYRINVGLDWLNF